MRRASKNYGSAFAGGASLRLVRWIVPTPTPSSAAILFQPKPLSRSSAILFVLRIFFGRPSCLPFALAFRRPALTRSTISYSMFGPEELDKEALWEKARLGYPMTPEEIERM